MALWRIFELRRYSQTAYLWNWADLGVQVVDQGMLEVASVKEVYLDLSGRFDVTRLTDMPDAERRGIGRKGLRRDKHETG